MNNTLPERLKQIRKEKGLTQDDVASAIGVGRTTYQAYEAGKIVPPGGKLISISELFMVPVDWLIGSTDQRDWYGSDDPDIMYHLGLFIAWLEESDRPRQVGGSELSREQSMIVAAALRGVVMVAREVVKRG